MAAPTSFSSLHSLSRPNLSSPCAPNLALKFAATSKYTSPPLSLPLIRRSSSSTTTRSKANQTSLDTLTTPNSSPDSRSDHSPLELVKSYYEGINRKDPDLVAQLIAEACVYEDLNFPRPFVGRKEFMKKFKKFTDSISGDLRMVIDDISGGNGGGGDDSDTVGVLWHFEWKGRVFPHSKGCSFYRFEVIKGKKQIIYGRDSYEPAIKPGELELVVVGGVTWLLERFPHLGDLL